MRVVLEEGIFGPGEPSRLDLLSLFRLPLSRSHTLEVDPPDSLGLQTWLEGLDVRTADECRFALELSYDELARRPKPEGVRVLPAPSASWERPVRLPLSLAIGFLETPLQVLVENNRRDRSFLRTVGFAFRATLDRLEGTGFQFVHGGGLSEMLEQVLVRSRQPEWGRRSFVIFDSDAVCPGRSGAANERLARICAERGVPFHRLTRRASENYLPPACLEQHATRMGRPRRERSLRTARAFGQLLQDQRHHYNMKRGLDGDQNHPDREAGEQLFAILDGGKRDALRHGFGESIGDLFEEAALVQDYLLAADGQGPEMMQLFEALLAEI
ncbi:MAG TPA: hypothetical protein VF017_01445 [Thermoanaerobaculia bacterium]|nr:hypothetical protein [Thermoanaerobaculia bacterium]